MFQTDKKRRLRRRMLALQQKDGSFQESMLPLDIFEHTAEISFSARKKPSLALGQ